MHEAVWLVASRWHVAAFDCTKQAYTAFLKVLAKEHFCTWIGNLVYAVSEVLIRNQAILIYVQLAEDFIEDRVVWLEPPMLEVVA